jgi:RimJ/RimL family protein N-acetyltransferase
MDDAQAVYTWQSDADVQQTAHTDISQTVEYIEWVTGEWQSNHQKYYSFGVMLGDKLIGEIGVSNRCGKCGRCVEGEAALGYGIHRDYWNCGYDTEAIDAIIEYCFTTLGTEKIKMSCDIKNLAELHERERLDMQLILENEDCETSDGKPFKRNTYILNKSTI